MINLVKAPINTIVVKGDHFSHNDILKMRNKKRSLEDKEVFGPTDIKIVFVYPSGHTNEVLTNMSLFNVLTDGDDDSIIYAL